MSYFTLRLIRCLIRNHRIPMLVQAVEAGELKINDVRVLIADITWNKGVIHILSEEPQLSACFAQCG